MKDLLPELRWRLRAAGVPVDRLTVIDDRHVDRPVFGGELGTQAVVLKRYTGAQAAVAAQTAHDVAATLWASPFGEGRTPPGLPRPIAVVPGSGLVVAEHLDGPALGARGRLGGAVTRAAEAARLLADLHGVLPLPLVGSLRTRSTAGVARSLRRKVAELESLAVAATATSVIEHIERIERGAPASGGLVVTHGDFTPRNLLATPAGLRLIDLDRVRCAAPGRDVGYWRAWCWATQVLAGEAPSWTATVPFVRAYLDRSSHEWGADATMPQHIAAGLVRIVHGWSALRDQPDMQMLLMNEALAIVRDPAHCCAAIAVPYSRGERIEDE